MRSIWLRYFLVASLFAVAGAAAPVEGVRFAAPPTVTQMRIEVRSAAGSLVYDSEWKEGNLLDWSAATLPYGSYSVRIFTKDLEGRTAEKQAVVRVAPDRIVLDPGAGDDIKLTTTLHDGESGQLVTTSGDLSFRFGDFLNRKDIEVMRLTAQGDLDVAGLIRTGQGIVFPDGSIQRSAAMPSIVRMRPSNPESDKKLHPKSQISGAGTTNQVTKWLDGSAGTVGDSAITEVGGKVGIGTTNPGGNLHISGLATNDVFAGMGPDIINGPGFNYGYAGGSFGLGAGFFNVRPATGATGVNPSLRFMTVDQQRMIITNAGNVGIGTSAPSQMLDVAGSVTLSGNLALPATTASAGVIMQGGSSFAHSFGAFNTFLGANAGNLTMTGSSNAGIGYYALSNNTSGNYSTASGSYALRDNTTGNSNTADGYFALRFNTNGVSNTASGSQALANNTTGSGNIAIGDGAGLNLTTGSNNIDIGNSGVAAESSTIRIGAAQTRAFIAGIRGATAGADAAAVVIDSSGQLGTGGGSAPTSADTPNTIVLRDGSGNFSASTITLDGNLALPANTSATAGVITLGGNRFAHSCCDPTNTFLGTNAGNFTMAGNSNTASGFQALSNNAAGSANTAIGTNALVLNTNGNSNTACGAGALLNNTTGGGNTASGYRALIGNTGSNNTGIGNNAGSILTTGSNNIDIGHAGVAAEANTIRIGISGTQTRAFIAGISGVTTGSAAVAVVVDANGQLGTVSSSRRYKIDIDDMAEATAGLMRLRPVTFRYLAHGDNAPRQYGLIAEEVAEVYPELVARNKDGQVDTVMYQFLAPMLLNEVQKQHRQLEGERQENVALRTRLERLEKVVAELKGQK